MTDQSMPAGVIPLVGGASRVTALSGAGMSAESGVPTFRDAQTGLWESYDPSELATPEAWRRNPALVWTWYEWRRALVSTCEPNAGHLAIAQWGRRAEVLIVTQNVDDLHERAGSTVLAHLHGSLFEHRCDHCGQTFEMPPPTSPEPTRLAEPPRCPHGDGLIRPGVVWFNESLPTGAFDRGVEAVTSSDLVVLVGTSGIVYPAAALPAMALDAGVPVIEINPHPAVPDATLTWRTTAARGLPALVAALG